MSKNMQEIFINHVDIVPAVVTKIPLTTHTSFPNVQPLFSKARTSSGIPTDARTNSTAAKLISNKL